MIDGRNDRSSIRKPSPNDSNELGQLGKGNGYKGLRYSWGLFPERELRPRFLTSQRFPISPQQLSELSMLASISRLAELSGYDRRTVSAKLVDLPSREGPKNAKLYEVSAAMRQLFAGAATPEGPLDPQTERALLDRERRRAIEMTNAKLAGTLLDASEVEAEWSNQIVIAKNRFLALPSRLAPMVIGLGDMRAIEQVIKAAIYDVLTELSGENDGTPNTVE